MKKKFTTKSLLKEFGWISPEQNKKLLAENEMLNLHNKMHVENITRCKNLIKIINDDVIPELLDSKETYEEKGQYQQGEYYCDLINNLRSIISEIEGE